MSEISEVLNQLLTQLAEELKANIPNASGKTAASIEVNVEDKTIGGFPFVSGTIKANKYFPVLETGRKPGKMPPVDSILEWVKARAFNFPMTTSLGKVIKTPESLSWAIAIKISKEGTKLFRDGGHSGVISNVLNEQRLDTFFEVFNSKASRIILDNVLTKLKQP